MIYRFNELVKKLQSTNSRLEKEAYLKEYENDEEVKEILHFLFNSYIITGISDKKYQKGRAKNYVYTSDIKILDFRKEILDYYKENKTGSDKDVAHLLYVINYMGLEDLISGIVKKDLRLGIDVRTLNKVYGKGFCPTLDVMLAHHLKDHMDYITGKRIIITKKLDGLRCVVYFEDNEWQMNSRNGLEFYGLTELLDEVKFLDKDYVYDGELLIDNVNNLPAKDLFRATQKYVSNEKIDIKTGLYFNVFDKVQKDDFKEGISEVSCFERKNSIQLELINLHNEGKALHIIEVPMLYVGDDHSNIERLFSEMIENEQEGVMVNVADAPWENKRTKNILKVKADNDADVLVKEIYKGNPGTKNANRLGGVTIEFMGPDGKYYTSNCGSGFKERNGVFGNDRQYLWDHPEAIIGKVIEVKYTDISKNQTDDNLSMRFPRFVRLRDDKGVSEVTQVSAQSAVKSIPTVKKKSLF